MSAMGYSASLEVSSKNGVGAIACDRLRLLGLGVSSKNWGDRKKQSLSKFRFLPTTAQVLNQLVILGNQGLELILYKY
ncbi:MAG: hypothetical protein V7K48_01835 [Nostoc sp.]|uniref:hypothetical protein n=1 Tax=Nostoc sp. TaxID=1180 RepID=UPI002FFCD93A